MNPPVEPALKLGKLEVKLSGWAVAAGFANEEKELKAFEAVGAVLLAENKLDAPAAVLVLPKLNRLLPVDDVPVEVPKAEPDCCGLNAPNELKPEVLPVAPKLNPPVV